MLLLSLFAILAKDTCNYIKIFLSFQMKSDFPQPLKGKQFLPTGSWHNENHHQKLKLFLTAGTFPKVTANKNH